MRPRHLQQPQLPELPQPQQGAPLQPSPAASPAAVPSEPRLRCLPRGPQPPSAAAAAASPLLRAGRAGAARWSSKELVLLVEQRCWWSWCCSLQRFAGDKNITSTMTPRSLACAGHFADTFADAANCMQSLHFTRTAMQTWQSAVASAKKCSSHVCSVCEKCSSHDVCRCLQREVLIPCIYVPSAKQFWFHVCATSE